MVYNISPLTLHGQVKGLNFVGSPSKMSNYNIKFICYEIVEYGVNNSRCQGSLNNHDTNEKFQNLEMAKTV